MANGSGPTIADQMARIRVEQLERELLDARYTLWLAVRSCPNSTVTIANATIELNDPTQSTLIIEDLPGGNKKLAAKRKDE